MERATGADTPNSEKNGALGIHRVRMDRIGRFSRPFVRFDAMDAQAAGRPGKRGAEKDEGPPGMANRRALCKGYATRRSISWPQGCDNLTCPNCRASSTCGAAGARSGARR